MYHVDDQNKTKNNEEVDNEPKEKMVHITDLLNEVISRPQFYQGDNVDSRS